MQPLYPVTHYFYIPEHGGFLTESLMISVRKRKEKYGQMIDWFYPYQRESRFSFKPLDQQIEELSQRLKELREERKKLKKKESSLGSKMKNLFRREKK